MQSLLRGFGAALTLGILASAVNLAHSQTAQVLTMAPAASIKIPQSKGKFDFLRIDAKRNRLLAAHENDGTADFIDLKNNRLIKRLKIGGAVDTAVDNQSKFYYVSVQEAERVAVIDAVSLTEVRSIKTPGPTDAILFDPKSHLIYVTHDGGAEVWVLDPLAGKVVATIAIPGVPEFMVYDTNSNRVYLNIKTKDLVVVIDPVGQKVVDQWATAPALLPHGLAFDSEHNRIFVAGGNGKLSVIDTKSGRVVDSVNIVPKVDQIAFDAAGALVYSAGVDRMSVVRTSGASITLLGDFPTAATAKNVAVDPLTRAVWTTYTDGGNSFAKSWKPPTP